ncbi:hypothetical protein IGI04_009391, partial [Brassica rapa subsp. trilocularis]
MRSSTIVMMMRRSLVYLLGFLYLLTSVNGLLSSNGVNFEVQALMDIKASLHDPHGVLDSWDRDAVDPCSWTMVTCSSENFVIGLGTPSQNLSGTLSPSITNLTNLRIVLLQNNNITGKVPSEFGRLTRLETLDLSDNFFLGEVPFSLGYLRSLQYMRLNNNSLSGVIPLSLSNMTQLALLDLSYNNLSAPVPRFAAKTFSIVGNPLICPTGKEPDCNGTTLIPMSMNLNDTGAPLYTGRSKNHKMAIAVGASVGTVSMIFIAVGLFLWWRQRNNQNTFFDVKDGHYHEEVSLGNLRRFGFRELQIATNNFSSKNLLGKGGYGNVYKGILGDNTVVAVKRLKDGNALGGEIQFQTEVEMISLAVHRNLLRLYGFCITQAEKLLIHQEKNLEVLVDKQLLKNKSYDEIELEEMVRVALLCTQYLPGHRPKMSEVVRMLEGDGLAERWEASQRSDSGSKYSNRIFEISDVTLLDETKDLGASNRRHLAALYCGATSGFELVHGLVDRIMEVMGVPFLPNGDKTGYHINRSEEPEFLPGGQASIIYKGEHIGNFGIVH